MNPDPDFVQWALAPERNVEELFCVQLLLEKALPTWKRNHKIENPNEFNWQLRHERHEARALNPAWRPDFSEIDVMRAAEIVPLLTTIDHWTHEGDRTVRDFSALRFCPALQKFQVGPTELSDLEWLRNLPGLVDFWIQDKQLADYSGLAHCPGLKQVHLWLPVSWCDLRALAGLSQLENLTLHGNLPTLEGVGPLPKVTKILFNGFGYGRAYLRDASALPEMPQLREAYLAPWQSLEGIEKFPALEELTVEGSYTDISPLAKLPNLRKLNLAGENFTDLSPLARAPRLAVLQLSRDMPIDYTPLLDSSSLRELLPRYQVEPSQEMIGLNAALGGWDSEFLLSAPRPLPSPRYRIVDHASDADPDFVPQKKARAVNLSPALYEAEAKWVVERVGAAITRALREPHWGKGDTHSLDAARCRVNLRLLTVEAAEHLPEIIEACRHQLAWCKNFWTVDITLDPLAEWERDPEEWKRRDEFEEHLAEAQEYVDRRKKYLAFLERLRGFRVRQELGENPPAEEFAAPPEKEEEGADEDSNLLEPEDDWEQSKHPDWQRYYMSIDVDEEGVWGHQGYKGKNERLTCHAFEVSPRQRPEYEAEKDD
jgi:Leucine-rich repeat (LRR) protein